MLTPSSKAGMALGTTKDTCLSMTDGSLKIKLDLIASPHACLKTDFFPPGCPLGAHRELVRALLHLWPSSPHP